MARRVTATVVGGKRLRAFVKAMPDESRAELYEVVKDGLTEIIEDAKQRVPVDTGALRDAMKVRVSKKTLRGRAGVLGNRGYVRLVDGGKRFYSKFVEFGTVKTPARPFLFPAYRARRNRLKMAIVLGFREAIAKANAKAGPMP